MSPEKARPTVTRADSDDPLVYTMHDLAKQARSIMSEIEKTGQPAFITWHGRFVAIITPLPPGQIESEALGEMARELAVGIRAAPGVVAQEALAFGLVP
jgi:hypothetical protein